MRTMLRGKFTLLFMTCAVLLAIPAVALADFVSNNIDNTIDTTLETMTLTQGGANGTTTVWVQADTAATDPVNGCNLKQDASLTVNVASGNTSVATVSPSSGTITACGEANGLPITVTPVGPGSTTISVTGPSSISNGGTFTYQANFTVNVKQSTSITQVAGTGTAGNPGSATLSAKLSSSLGDNMASKTVSFAINPKTSVCDNDPSTALVACPTATAQTVQTANGDYVATANNVSLPSTFTVANSPYTVTASYAGDTTYGASSGTGNLVVNPANTAPVANGQTGQSAVSATEDVAKTITLTGSDADGNNLSFSIVTQPAHGSLGAIGTPVCDATTKTCSADVTYTPTANYNGSDSFTFKVNDRTVDSTAATVDINVAAVNDVPQAANDGPYTTDEDTPLSVTAAQGVLVNDSDADGDTLSAVLVSGPSHKAATNGFTLNANGSFSYTPAANYNGSDSFTYKVNDGTVDSATATVSITVNAVNDAPVNTVPGAQNIDEDNSLTFSSANGNALSISDVDAGSNPVKASLGVTHGTLTLGSNSGLSFATGDGTDDASMVFTGTLSNINSALSGLTFNPTANYNGSATLTLTSNDQGYTGSGGALSDTDTVTINIAPVNDPPTANAQSVSTNEDNAKAITLTADDVDGDALSYIIVSGPSNGVLSGTGANRTYTPAANYNGSDSFTFKANDGTVDSNTATVSITVNAVNDAPSFTKGADQTVLENAGAQTVTGWATNIQPGPLSATDESGQTVDFLVSNNNNTLFSAQPAVSSNGTLTFTPATGAVGTATVSVQIHDNGGTANGGVDTSAVQTFKINVNYGFSGFLQPINDTSHMISLGPDVSTFKQGSTVPVKFYLTDANGNRVQAASAEWITPQQGSKTSQAVDEALFTDPATSGSLYRWDSTAQQYIYNWSTKSALKGYYYKIGVRLNDGQTYTTYISLN
ncbi:MAG: Ig-like domain-containing protein [Chloroflexota bacterium]|nr:Ig-like domain-containing protein [Chloroflexota bacterium]